MDRNLSRRNLLQASAVGAVGALAGCVERLPDSVQCSLGNPRSMRFYPSEDLENTEENPDRDIFAQVIVGRVQEAYRHGLLEQMPIDAVAYEDGSVQVYFDGLVRNADDIEYVLKHSGDVRVTILGGDGEERTAFESKQYGRTTQIGELEDAGWVATIPLSSEYIPEDSEVQTPTETPDDDGTEDEEDESEETEEDDEDSGEPADESESEDETDDTDESGSEDEEEDNDSDDAESDDGPEEETDEGKSEREQFQRALEQTEPHGDGSYSFKVYFENDLIREARLEPEGVEEFLSEEWDGNIPVSELTHRDAVALSARFNGGYLPVEATVEMTCDEADADQRDDPVQDGEGGEDGEPTDDE